MNLFEILQARAPWAGPCIPHCKPQLTPSFGFVRQYRFSDVASYCILSCMPTTVVIRARLETRDLLHDLAKEDGTTVIDTLDRLIREAAEARLLGAVVADLSCVRENNQDELASWDASLADGLDPDDDFSSWR
jgi:hypothetical protein